MGEVPIERPDEPALGCSISVYLDRRPRRVGYEAMQLHIPGYSPIIWDSHDPETIECGFKKRLLRAVPPSESGLLVELQTFVRDWVAKEINPVIVGTFEEWLDGTDYNGGRKEELRRAFELYRGAPPPMRVSRRIKSFMKTESYGKYKHCRLINSRHDAFKAYSGRFFKAIEDEVFKCPYFIKHVPVTERPALIAAMERAGLHYYITDYTAFESHMGSAIMEVLEVELYKHALSNYPEAADYISRVLIGENHMHVRGVAKAKCQARRMSGDMCTSLGNGFTNLMLALFVASKCGTAIQKGQGYFEGDDGLFATSLPIDKKWFERCGFTIKLLEIVKPTIPIPLYEPVDPGVAFCGMAFAVSGQAIREPRKFLQTFAWTHHFLGASELVHRQLQRGKALSALYETPACPIVTEYAKLVLSRTNGVNPRYVADGYHKAPPGNPTSQLIQDDTRLLFESMYGVSVATQLQIEGALRNGDVDVVAALLPPTADISHYYARFVET